MTQAKLWVFANFQVSSFEVFFSNVGCATLCIPYTGKNQSLKMFDTFPVWDEIKISYEFILVFKV